MDELCREQRNSEKVLTDQEKMQKAIKKAKADRARKAVNNSLNRSIASIKRRKQKKQATLDQIFALKQASELQQKNSVILSALTKAKQYNQQLENANYCFKEQQNILSHQLSLKMAKIQKQETENEILKRRIEDADKKLKMIRKSFSYTLLATTNVIEGVMNNGKAENRDLELEKGYLPNQNFEHETSSSNSESRSSIDSVSSGSVTSHEIVSMDMTNTTPASDISLQENMDIERKTGSKENVPPTGISLEGNNEKITENEISARTLQNCDCNEKLDNDRLSERNLSLRFTRRSSTERYSISEIDDENERPIRRKSSRSATAVTYAEPSLISKLRRGDKTADDSLYHSFTPKKIVKKRRKNAKVAN